MHSTERAAPDRNAERMTLEFHRPAIPRLWLRAAASLLAAVLGVSAFAAALESELLEPEKAFRISTRPLDERNVEVRFEIADGYYMYRDRFKFETAAGKLLADVELPKGKVKEDPFFGKQETYRREVRIRVPVTPADAARGNVKLKVTSQGCADSGVCYVPLEQFVEVRLGGTPSAGTSAGLAQAGSWLPGLTETVRSQLGNRGGWSSGSGVFLAMLAAFFAFGFAAGMAQPSIPAVAHLRPPVEHDLLRVAVRLLIYTIGGAATGVAGGAILGDPPGALESTVLSLAFAGLAAAALLTNRSAVTVVTTGALLLVAKLGDTLLGAAGMGLLALSLGLAPSLAGWRHAPAAARWSSVLLGVTASALAIWTSSPLVAGSLRDLAWGVLLIMGGVYLRALDPLPPDASAGQRLAKGIGFIATAAGVIMLAFAAGGREPILSSSASRSTGVAAPHFERVADLREFEARVRGSAKPTMLDFYADWCVSCKEMERFTFSDSAVRSRMLKMQLLQVDVTHNTAPDKEFLRRFGLFGPPGVLFFDAEGNERRSLRVIGYQPAERFVKVLDAALREGATAAALEEAK